MEIREKIKKTVVNILEQYQFCGCMEGDIKGIRERDINEAAEEITKFICQLLKEYEDCNR